MNAMKPFLLVTVLFAAPAFALEGVRLLPEEPSLRQRLIDEQPTFAKSVTMMVVGSAVATSGVALGGLGAGMILSASATLLAGIGIFIGAVCLAVGGAALVFGALMALHGGRNLRYHYRINEQLESMRTGRASPDAAMATLASF